MAEGSSLNAGTSLVLAALISLTTAGWAAEPAASEVPPLVRIERVSSGKSYAVTPAKVGARPYVDREFNLGELGAALTGHTLVQTSNDDDFVEAADHLTLQLSAKSAVFVCVDVRAARPASWLPGWAEQQETVRTAGTAVSFRVYRRTFPAGKVVLGGNERKLTGGDTCNYFVIVAALAAPSPPADAPDFAREIQPLLAKRCHGCHGPDKQEAGLRLDLRRRALLGGDSGRAILARSAEDSPLVLRIASMDETDRMPPDGEPLSAKEIARIRNWIDHGAAWPDALAGHEALDDHWSFRPVHRPPPPEVRKKDWPRGPLDAFVLAALEQKGLEPSAEADRPTLIRRLYLDLVGLAPQPDEVAAFLGDNQPQAYERVVDRLLASPHYGERWGKHWLDLARFAESDGYENDVHRPHAWRYRDWVIQALNRDLPYDQFTIDQLAGDLRPESRPEQRIATGFHRNTLHNGAGGADAEEFRVKAVKDRTATTGTVWLGLTFNCCECHSHKYDPIAHREYYEFYAFFNNTDHTSEGEAPTLKGLERTAAVHRRGNFLDPGETVQPGTPACLPPMVPRGSRADRLDLAHWLTSGEHPLTARVAVNRYWQQLFGQGLVHTAENFGRKGSPPSHPELLDWLAAEFVERGWSAKQILRTLVTSATYRQRSHDSPQAAQVDPENLYYWRQNRLRVEAEIVRDLALGASGLLDRATGGPSVQPPLPKGLSRLAELKNERFQESGGNSYRRGIYVHMQRTFPYPMLAAFDAPDGNQACVRRDRSSTPMQALTLLNDPVFDECARVLGQRMAKESQDRAHRLRFGFQLCLTRPPADDELAVLSQLIDEQQQAGASEAAAWQGVARALLNLEEFITRE